MIGQESADGSEHAARAKRSPILRSKLRVPWVPAHFVPRGRLNGLLDEIVSRPLTLVNSPAGSGKTMALASWVAASAVPTAWLSLDETNATEAEFWFELVAALESLVPGCGTQATQVLANDASMRDVVVALLDGLESGAGRSCVLVVDDLHVIGAVGASESLSVFLQHLPPWLHVVLLSRNLPNLPLERLRGRGLLSEIRFSELRFSATEGRELLRRLAPSLTDAAVEAAVVRSEGWAASLHLTALAARTVQSHGEVGPPQVDTGALIEDYTWHEVLATSDPDLLAVLLDVSVVDRVSVGLAFALTGRRDATELLLRAEAQGMFVARFGSEGWFRVHPVVRKVLLDELTRQCRHREQHALAAQYLESQNDITEALEQWLLAARPRDALRLLTETSAVLYDTGHEATIRRTIAAIPPSVTTDVSALLDFAFSNLLVRRRTFVESVEKVTWLAARSDIDDSIHARLTMLQAISNTVLGAWHESHALALRALSAMDDGASSDPFSRFGWNTVARSVALQEQWDDEREDIGNASIATSRDPERGLTLEGIRALGLALAGRPIDALRVAAGVVHAAPAMSILASELALAEAIALRDLGDPKQADVALETIIDTAAESTLYCRVLAAMELTRAHLDSRDLDAANHSFSRAESLIADDNIGQGMKNWFANTGTVLSIASDDLKAAHTLAESIDDSFWRPVSLARVHLAAGDRATAYDTLIIAVPRCVRHEVIRGILLARASSDTKESLGYAAVALQNASETGLLQTVASECKESMDIVERCAWRVPDEWMDRLRRAAARTAHEIRPSRTLIEPLTDRERDVLRLLPSRLTLREIANELYVSMNTLKFHLRVIYRKLGVNSREEAAAFARAQTTLRTTASLPT